MPSPVPPAEPRGEPGLGSRTLACGENSRRSCQSTGLHTAVSGVTWLETSPGLTPPPRALGSDQDGMFAPW